MPETQKTTILDILMYPWNVLMRTSENAAGITLAVVIGLSAGVGAYAFWKLIEFFSWLFFKKGADGFSFLGDYYVIILPALGGLIFGPIVYFFAREAKGEGPPEIIEADKKRATRKPKKARAPSVPPGIPPAATARDTSARRATTATRATATTTARRATTATRAAAEPAKRGTVARRAPTRATRAPRTARDDGRRNV